MGFVSLTKISPNYKKWSVQREPVMRLSAYMFRRKHLEKPVYSGVFNAAAVTAFGLAEWPMAEVLWDADRRMVAFRRSTDRGSLKLSAKQTSCRTLSLNALGYLLDMPIGSFFLIPLVWDEQLKLVVGQIPETATPVAPAKNGRAGDRIAGVRRRGARRRRLDDAQHA